MRIFKDEMKQRQIERRNRAAGGWAGLIIKIALLIVILFIMNGLRTGKFRIPTSQLQKKNIEQQKEMP
jgi:hypothetical protein